MGKTTTSEETGNHLEETPPQLRNEDPVFSELEYIQQGKNKTKTKNYPLTLRRNTPPRCTLPRLLPPNPCRPVLHPLLLYRLVDDTDLDTPLDAQLTPRIPFVLDRLGSRDLLPLPFVLRRLRRRRTDTKKGPCVVPSTLDVSLLLLVAVVTSVVKRPPDGTPYT